MYLSFVQLSLLCLYLAHSLPTTLVPLLYVTPTSWSWCSTLWWTSVMWLSRVPFWFFGLLWQFWRSPTCTCKSLLPARWIARPLTALELAFYLWLFCSPRPLHKRSYLTRDVRFQWSTPITVPLFCGLAPILAHPRRRYHGNLQPRRRRRTLTYDTSYYEALSSANGPTWYDADLCSHLMQDELDSLHCGMVDSGGVCCSPTLAARTISHSLPLAARHLCMVMRSQLY